ncbi:MAG: YfhO family protein [Verrucomicrobiota bacterium]
MSDTTGFRTINFFTPLRFGLFLALLVFAAFPQVLLGLQTFVVRDYGFFAYPLAHFQQECFQHGQLPLWNPYNNCGVPFLAQWNTMPLYPPSLIYLLLPLTWSLSFFCLLHLWFAGLGMYFLARRWTGNHFAAAFAGVAFSFNGLTLNLLMWPSHVATLSWMPWVVLAVEFAWREGGQKLILAALVGAMQMLAGGPEIILLTWLLLLALWIQQFVKGESPRAAMLRRLSLVVLLVMALTAAQLLPFLDLSAHSQRGVGYADARWSMPGWGWVNFLVPMVFGRAWTEGVFFQYGQSWTSSYYLGIGTLWLALLALWTVRERRVWLLGGATVLALFLAFGENTFVYPALRRIIPQLSFVTYPVKYVTLVAFLMPLLAAFALARLQNLERGDASPLFKAPTRQRTPKFSNSVIFVGIILLTLLAGILFWAWRFPFPTDDIHATLLNGLARAFFLLVTGGLLLLLTRGAGQGWRRLAPLLLIVVAWLDVFTHEPSQNPTVPPSVYELNLARADLKMDPLPALGGSRAMVSPMAAIQFIRSASSDPKRNYLAKRAGYCANVNLLDGVPKVDGFFSLTPRESDDVLSLFYATTNADFPRLEDFMGVSQITAPGEIFRWQSRPNFLPLATAGQKPVFLDAAATLRALTQPDFDGSKVVFLPPEAEAFVTVTNQTAARVLKSHFGIQSADIEVEADAPSLVVVAQTWYHNWRAEVDGKPVRLLRANDAFQSVEIPEGRHRVQLFYRDRAFDTGAVISLLALLACLICVATSSREKTKYG